MPNIDDSFIAGFIKRAGMYSLTEQEAVALLKSASSHFGYSGTDELGDAVSEEGAPAHLARNIGKYTGAGAGAITGGLGAAALASLLNGITRKVNPYSGNASVLASALKGGAIGGAVGAGVGTPVDMLTKQMAERKLLKERLTQQEE